MQILLSDPRIPLIAYAASAVLLIAVVAALWRRVSRLLAGKDAKSLEETILSLKQEVAELRNFQQDSEAYLENVEARLRRSIQSIETVRFNPWKGTGEGGNQSFATALLNEHGDGVVLSSLYSRERVSVFSKPIKKHASEYELTEEEIEALKASKKSVEIGKDLHI